MRDHAAALTLIAGLIVGVTAPAGHSVLLGSGASVQSPTSQTAAPSSQSPDETVAYVCPMHSEQTSDVPAKCKRCGMALVLASPYDTRDYGLTLETVRQS